MNIILFGPPGAGKGTQADILAKELNLYKVSSGNLLRELINKKNDFSLKIKAIIDKGSLVSDDIINRLVTKVISNKLYFNRLIFDGYPRNMNQTKILDILLKKYNQKLSYVLSLKVDEVAIIKRISGRQLCIKCGSVFNEFYNKSTEENHSCDPKFLEKRSDDNEKVLRNRFKTYQKETAPILNHYKKQNLFTEIDGMQKIDEIYSKIREIIHPLKT